MSLNERSDVSTADWWRAHVLDEGAVLGCKLGPLRVSIRRDAREWRVAHRRDEASADDLSAVELRVGSAEIDGPEAVDRFFVRQTARECSLAPALADRSVVSRPEKPFNVPSGESATLFVSSPVWLRIEEGAGRRVLMELPSVVPSDTWFGPSTREGELCYATRTSGRVRLEDVPLRPHRVVTPVTIENRGEGHLQVERLSLPTPFLSIFSAPHGFLWTEAVTLVREDDGDLARLRVGDGASEFSRGGERVTQPRRSSEDGNPFRAFGTLFS